MLYSRPEAVLTAVLLAAGLLPMNANAYVSFSKNGEELINTLHTHIYSPTLSLPSSKEIKVAKVCFITDVSDCSGNEFSSSEDLDNPNEFSSSEDLDNPSSGGNPDYDLNDAERCRNEGYTISGCPDGFEPSGKCSYGDYYTKCIENCPSNYVTCDEPYVGVGEACGGKYASCTCTPCEAGFDYTEIPEGYVQDGEACLDCDGVTKYKVKVNPCDGFMDCGSMGGAAGAETCLSGTVTKYDNCKPCPNLGTLTSCPSPYTCTYEECSNRYYKSGCQSGYDWNLTTKTCTVQCESSYKYICTGANESPSGTACGGKYQSCTCANESPSGTACGGKYQSCTCADGYVWEHGKCAEEPKAVWGECTGYAANCEIGDIVFSDGTCSSDKVSGKLPIAVVAYKSSDGKCGQALAIKSAGQINWGFYGSSSNEGQFDDTTNLDDYNSCKNTLEILKQQSHKKYLMASTAHNVYLTIGTSAGDWCLPAAGIFTSYNKNKEAINSGLEKAGGVIFTSDSRAWSSSDCNDCFMSHMNFGDSYGLGCELLEIRPVIEF